MNAASADLPVLVTGASGGIGADLARIFARKGHRVALVARNRALLEKLAGEEDFSTARPLIAPLDLSVRDVGERLASILEEANFTPAILVNNAGYGLLGQTASLDREEQLGILDLNIRSLTELTLRFLPGIEEARGRILNVASTAAFLPGPGMAIYYASKAYVLSFSQALHHEVRGRGVTVSALCPGPTATGFFERAGARKALLNGLVTMSSIDVAQAGYDGLMRGKRVIVPGLFNKLTATAAPLTPKSLLLPIVARLQKDRT